MQGAAIRRWHHSSPCCCHCCCASTRDGCPSRFQEGCCESRMHLTAHMQPSRLPWPSACAVTTTHCRRELPQGLSSTSAGPHMMKRTTSPLLCSKKSTHRLMQQHLAYPQLRPHTQAAATNPQRRPCGSFAIRHIAACARDQTIRWQGCHCSSCYVRQQATRGRCCSQGGLPPFSTDRAPATAAEGC
jgi:hypothetical protein